MLIEYGILLLSVEAIGLVAAYSYKQKIKIGTSELISIYKLKYELYIKGVVINTVVILFLLIKHIL